MDKNTKIQLETKLRKMLQDSEKKTTETKARNESKTCYTGNIIRKRKGEPQKRISKKHKSITRMDIEDKKTHGWNVRVFYKGKMHKPKFFSDRLHNGVEKALEQAIKYRDQIEIEIGKPRTERIVVSQNPFNKTRKIGVRKIRKQTGSFGKDGKPNYSEVYEVTWCPKPNVTKRTSVSIRAHGEEEAYKRACAIRDSKEQEIYGQLTSKAS